MRSFLTLAENVAVNEMAQVPEGAFDKLMYGLNVSFIGIVTVFAVLAIIMGVLYLFRLYFYDIPNKKNSENAQPKAAPAPAVQKVAAPVANVTTEDDELVPVVIAAAVAAYMETNAPKSKYRIRSFKRI
ncbi:MAG: hypothetical protein E7477_06345 [Ruminococcaceae bacterium]|nr:hypothetical protein [Oscillospiraceae bacterium]